MYLRYTQHEATGSVVAGGGVSRPEPERAERVWQRALPAHLAFRGAVSEVSGSTRRISGELSRLKASHRGIAGRAGSIFVRYVDYGERQRAGPATLGVGLMVGSNGVMMGTRLVVSAEWVEMMRQLVRAGVLSVPAVSAAVRIQAGQVMMAEAHGELPQGVREALGDGPEVRGMHVTGKAGAGMAEPPEHHVMPKEFREWFEKRGFTGEMDIDQFCVRLDQAHHQAIHGGGNWKLGRAWPGEWNRMIMEALYKAETRGGRMLTRNTVLEIVAEYMKEYSIPMNFIRWRGR